MNDAYRTGLELKALEIALFIHALFLIYRIAMTISYNSEISTIGIFGVFWRLLLRWKGSIYKLVLADMALYILCFYTLNLFYTYVLNPDQQIVFKQVVKYCRDMTSSIPMSFVLGFYVSIVVQRWWDQYTSLPWPDALAVYVSTNIQGSDDRGRLIRRTIMRYVNLSFVYTMSQICVSVKRRFPTLNHLVDAGILTEKELEIFEAMNKKTKHLKYWMPLVWAGSIVVKARKEGRIRDDFAVKTIIDSINAFRLGLLMVLNFDWVPVPLVYTQTVTLAVYTFLIAEMMGRQFAENDTGSAVDLLVPIYSFLSFFFYMGWLRVAETLFNPFGEDDDDFEVNWIIDRNLQISYIIVDEMHEDHPELVRDQYWEEVVPKELPYTEEADRKSPPRGSTMQITTAKAESPAKTTSVHQNNASRAPSAKLDPHDVESVISASEYPIRTESLFQPRFSIPEAISETSQPLTGRSSKPKLFSSVRALAKKLNNRVVDEASVRAAEMTDSTAAGRRKSSSSLVGGGDSDSMGATTEPEMVTSIVNPHRPLGASTPTEPSQTSLLSALSNTHNNLVPTAKESQQKFVPGDYAFLTTGLEDEMTAEEPPATEELQDKIPINSTRRVSTRAQESAISKLLQALSDKLHSTTVVRDKRALLQQLDHANTQLDDGKRTHHVSQSDQVTPDEEDQLLLISSSSVTPDVHPEVDARELPNYRQEENDERELDVGMTPAPSHAFPLSMFASSSQHEQTHTESSDYDISAPVESTVPRSTERNRDTAQDAADDRSSRTTSVQLGGGPGHVISQLGDRLQSSLHSSLHEMLGGSALWPPIFDHRSQPQLEHTSSSDARSQAWASQRGVAAVAPDQAPLTSSALPPRLPATDPQVPRPPEERDRAPPSPASETSTISHLSQTSRISGAGRQHERPPSRSSGSQQEVPDPDDPEPLSVSVTPEEERHPH